MADLPSKTHLSPDGAVLNDEGGFVLPDNITREDIDSLLRRAAGEAVEEWASQELDRQCRGTGSKNPVGVLNWLKETP